MKIEQESFVIERSDNVLRREKCRIEVNQYSIKQLSANIYTNQIRAVIRELSTNSYDSHIAAGNPDPFEVHLPNEFEPFLQIKDFGIGLSEDDVFKIYGSYFNSTKRDSNEYVGAIGIGSKSIFAVSNTNQVVSCHNGIKSIYSVNLDEDAIPEISLLHQEPTEESGFEVTIPIPSHQHKQFKTEAEFVFRFFKQRPIITGQQVNIQPFNVLFEGSDFKICKGEQQSYIVSGNVPYPVSFDYDWPKIIVQCPVGGVDFTPSREQLTHSDKTTKFIRDTKERIQREVGEDLQKKLAESKTEWDVCHFLNKSCDFGYQSLYKICQGRHITWQGRQINLGRVAINVPSHILARDVANGRKQYSVRIYPGDQIYVQNTKLPLFVHVKERGGDVLLSMKEGLWRPIVKWLKKKGAKPEHFTLTSDIERAPRKRGVRNKVYQYSWAKTEKNCWIPITQMPQGKCYFVFLEGYNLLLNGRKSANSASIQDLDLALDAPIIGLRKGQFPPSQGINLETYLKELSTKYMEPNRADWNAISYLASQLENFRGIKEDIDTFLDELKVAREVPIPSNIVKVAQAFFNVERNPVQTWRKKLDELKEKYDFLAFMDESYQNIQILLKYVKGAK